MFFTDQLNNTIELHATPKRIISIVPSQSELLWDLGLREELVGITKFCIHPHELYKTVSRVGGTKVLNFEKIRLLKPDLIIGNKEENEQEQVKALQQEFNVWMSDIYTLPDALQTITSIGTLVNKTQEASVIAEQINQSFHHLQKAGKTVLYLIWKNPFMAAGRATFIGDMIERTGLVNCLPDPLARYPQLAIDDIKMLKPELIFLSSEPYPFKEKHINELQELLPATKIMLVDGELFSWYGSRLLKSADYFNRLIQQL